MTGTGVKPGRVNSEVLFRWFVAAHFGGGSLPAYPVVSLPTRVMIQDTGTAACVSFHTSTVMERDFVTRADLRDQSDAPLPLLFLAQ